MVLAAVVAVEEVTVAAVAGEASAAVIAGDGVDGVDLGTVAEGAVEGSVIVVEDAEGMCDQEVSLHLKARKRRSDRASSLFSCMCCAVVIHFFQLKPV